MEVAPCSITFKIDENPSLDIKDLKNKEQGQYTITGWIRWMGEVIKKSIPNSLVTKTLQEGITLDTTGHMLLTAWVNHISKIIESRWYQITDIAIRKYYDKKLLATPISIFEETEKWSTLYWPDLDIPNYLNHEKVVKK